MTAYASDARVIAALLVLGIASSTLMTGQELLLGATAGVSRSTMTHLNHGPRHAVGGGLSFGLQVGDISVQSGVNVVEKGVDNQADSCFYVY